MKGKNQVLTTLWKLHQTHTPHSREKIKKVSLKSGTGSLSLMANIWVALRVSSQKLDSI